jgi:flagellar basal body-associated protein FliL
MSENLATRAKKKSILTYLVLAAIFVAIFGGITLIAFFVSKLNF